MSEDRLKAAIADIERVGREYPDGVHTCAELQQLEPGRRPCTCGRCPAAPAKADRWTSLRDQITRDAATEQELADGYSDMGAEDSANHHWSRAETLREVLATMDRMEAGQ